MTDRRNATLADKSEARRLRYEARAKIEEKLGRKLKPNEQVDHKDPKLASKSYNNSSSNLKVVTKSEHKEKMKNSDKETGGRPKGSKDTVKRKARTGQ